MQAEGSKSDCILKPVALYPDASRKDAYIVLSEVMHPDGTPHSTNYRATIENDPDLWVGLEQEYFLYKDGRPLGFPKDGYPNIPQGPYYCGVGYKYMGSMARTIVEEHLELCLPPASTTKASTPKSPRASGSSRSSPKAPPRPPTTSGPRAT
jgi:glutamine synthetase